MKICSKRDLSFCLNVHALPRCQKLTPIKDNFNEPKNVNDKISPVCISGTSVLSQLSIFEQNSNSFHFFSKKCLKLNLDTTFINKNLQPKFQYGASNWRNKCFWIKK